MDRAALQKQMEEVRDLIAKNEREHEGLLALLKGFEGWFRLNPEDGVSPAQLEFPAPGRGVTPLGTMSFNKGVVSVLKQAHGEPLRDVVIWRRMQALGVKSNAENPVGWVNREATKHAKIEKAGPKTWRWIWLINGEENGST